MRIHNDCKTKNYNDMKRKNFTAIFFGLLISGFTRLVIGQSYGTGWGITPPGEPLIIQDNFTDFPFLHADSNPDQGNSDNLDPENPGYKDTTAFRVCINSSDTIFYDFYQCAFAPNWQPAYGYRDSLAELTPPVPPEVSRGFVEVARYYESHATDSGYFIIDLRQVQYLEVIQYTHSSCGGNKRGFTLRKSIDDGVTWDTVRYQRGGFTDNYPESANAWNCQESAYGMVWEDALYLYESNVMLKFSHAVGQAVRIHDFKAYGWVEPETGINDNDIKQEVSIYCSDKTMILSEPADIVIFNMNGVLVKKAKDVETVSTADLPEGMYVVKARTDRGITTKKILNQ